MKGANQRSNVMKVVRSLVCAMLVVKSTSTFAQGTVSTSAADSLKAMTPAQRYAEICPGRREGATGAIVGRVRDVDDSTALAGATVSTDWTDYTVSAIGRTAGHARHQETKANGSGFYLLCGVPVKLRLDVRTELAGVMAGPTPIVLDDRLMGSLNFAISRKDGGAHTVKMGDSTVMDANAPGTATISGTVRGGDGRPLINAALEVLGTQRAARTDANGAFRLARIPAGTRTVEVRSIGFEPVFFSTDLATNAIRDTTISITAQAQQLAKVDVKGNKALPSWMERSGFDARKTLGMGSFMTQEDIGRHGYSDVVSVLQSMRGIRIERGGEFPSVQLVGAGARCNPNFFLDGVRFTGSFRELSGIATPEAVKGIEVYSNAGTVPPQFYIPSTNCGSIVVWMR
jgi:Carboxypeptidase regulatory-like domain/TonB-dependent Receptor Plug Domain